MKKILVLFGGISPEHEVAIVTALQVMNALKEAGLEVLPGYVSKEGVWVLGDERFFKPGFYKDLDKVVSSGKKIIVTPDRSLGVVMPGMFMVSRLDIDVVFPVFHGRNGEDGAIQGLLELTGLPYVGCGITASATGIDKYVSKRIAENIGLNVVEDVLVTKDVWDENRDEVLKNCSKLGNKVFVKPATLGSSIGVTKVDKKEDLEDAIEVGLAYDSRVVVEKAVDKPIEVNISIMGNGPYQVSVTEQPTNNGALLSFEDKYLKPGTKGSKRAGMASLQRIMPANVSEMSIKEIEENAKLFFTTINGKGISRIDFMVDSSGKVYFNEINTMPGSLSFYLWEKSGKNFSQLVKELVELAARENQIRKTRITTFQSNILSSFSNRSVKGGKIN